MRLEPMPLSQLAAVRSGGGAPQDPSAFTKAGYPFIRAGSLPRLLDGATEDSLERLEPRAADKHGLNLFPAGTVVFAKSGMSATKGHVYRLKAPAYVVSHLAALIPHDRNDSEFLVRVLQRFSPTLLIKDPAYPSIRLGDIENMKVLAPLDGASRRRIAEILDKADALRAKRRAALAQLDALTQSIFIESFVADTKFPFPAESLESACELITDGTHYTPTYSETGVIFLSSRNVTSGYITWDDVKFIPKSLHTELHRRVAPRMNDVLLAKNGTTGVAAIVDRDCVFDIYVSLALLRPSQRVLPIYLQQAINSPACARQFNASLKGIGVPNLHLKEIRKTKIPIPPIELQRDFARRITAVEKLKTAHRTSLAELDALFASIQHRAFRGDL